MRRSLTWTALAILLAACVLAIYGVWSAENRVWFVNTGGIRLTLDAALSDGGRWLATAVLGGIGLLSLAALVSEFVASRRPAYARFEHGMSPESVRAVTYTPKAASSAAPVSEKEHETQRARYDGMVVGDDATQRMERSLLLTPSFTRGGDEATAQDEQGDLRAALVAMQRQLDELQRKLEPREFPANQQTRPLSTANRR